MDPEIINQNQSIPAENVPNISKKKYFKIIGVILVLIVLIFLSLKFNLFSKIANKISTEEKYNPRMILPEKQTKLPEVFSGWPVKDETSAIIHNEVLDLPSPIEKKYTVTYTPAKSLSEILNQYQKIFRDKGLVFREEVQNNEVKNFTEVMTVNLANENASLSVKAEQNDAKVFVVLTYTKFDGNFKVQPLASMPATMRQNIPDLVLSKNFPENFPIISGAKIIESYNIANLENGTIKEAAAILISKKSLKEVKNFYVNNLKSSSYKLVPGFSKYDTAEKAVLVFTDKVGLLNILITREAGQTIIKINQSF